MARVMFINFPAHGHTNPSLPLVTELVHRGEQVTYYSFDDFRSKIECTGAAFCSYQSVFPFDHEHVDENLVRLATILLEATSPIVNYIVSSIATNRPDYLIYDSLCIWGKYIAHILDLPSICSTTTFAFNRKVTSSSFSQTINMLRMFLWAAPCLPRFHAAGKYLQKVYGLSKPKILEVFGNSAMLNLVYTSAYFQPFASSFPESFKFVGPSLPIKLEANSAPFPELGDVPLIYISLGTVFNEQADFYRLCFDALSNMKQHVVLSVGRKTDMAALGNFPSNFTIRNFVPQLQVLQRSVLFVTHGGMNSVNEALYFGVPMIVIPQAADQEWVAQRVTELGAGTTLMKIRLNARHLRNAVDTILANPSFQIASAQIGKSFKEAGGFIRAVDEIEIFKKKQDIN